MKVILYERDSSFLSSLVSFVTGSKYTHSAVLLRYGKCYFSDSSLSEGIILTPIHKIPDYLKNRKYIIYQLKDTSPTTDLEAFNKASSLTGSTYDVKGALFWTFYRTLKAIGLKKKNSKLYCFEYTLEILKCYYTIEDQLTYAPTGDTIKDFMEENGVEVRFLNCDKVG